MKKVFSIIVFVGIIVLLSLFLVPGIIDQNQSRNAAKTVLNNVIEQDYEKAFESVYFYDIATDLEPTISYEEAKNIWINRVKALKENGTYVVEYNGLRVDLDDTYPVGTVDLVIMESGNKIEKKGVRLWFGRSDGGWKLGYLYYDNENEEIFQVLSGDIR